jgi:hypothetical protein
MTLTNGFYWTGTGGFISHLPSTAIFYSEVSPPIVADFNGYGSNEIVTAWKIDPQPNGFDQDYNPFVNDIYGFGEWGTIGEDWSGGVVAHDARNGQQNFVYHFYHLLEAGLAVGKAKPGRTLNVYALNDSDSVVSFDKTLPHGLWGKGMLHKQYGKAQRLMCGSYEIPIDVYTADLDGDGLDETLMAGTQLSPLWQPNETIMDDDGAIMWRRWLPHIDITHNYGWHNSSCLIPVNPDHDNHADVLGFNHSYEITFRYWNGAELVDRPGWPKNFYPLLPTPPVVGDVDGDGQEEIIIGTYNPSITPSVGNLMIYALDGTLKQIIPVPGGLKHIPALADVEGNGHLDVIFRSLLGQVYVYNFGATTTNLVSWATHRGNMRRDGNRNGSFYPPGTPLVTKKTSGYNRASFTWSNSTPAQLYRIFRAEKGDGPFLQVATVLPSTNSYTDAGLKPGVQYFYEVRAVYATNTVPSVPFVVLSMYNSNLLANAGFEENDNSHWDKWFSGSVEMTNMLGSTNIFYQGRQSMRVILENQTNSGTIAQFDQYGIPDSTLYVTPGTFYSYGGFFKSGGISAPSQHWLTWISTKTGYDTNNRPNLPWPYYFTPSFVADTNVTGWVYVNRTFQLPSGFPNVELGHSFSMNTPGSGSIYMDNLFFRSIPSPTATNWANLVPFGSSWKFFTNVPPSNWYFDNFNDNSWQQANAKFGAGSGPTNIVTRLPQLRTAYYFRKSFVLNSDVEDLLLTATCTDDSGSALYPIRVFLNGNQIPASIETVTAQGNEPRYFDLTPFSNFLRPGTNSIAVCVSNYWADWDDVAFDVSLKAVLYHPCIPKLSVQLTSSQPPRLSMESAPGTVWQIQSRDSVVGDSPWQLAQVFTNSAGGVQVIQDTGQNGRAMPTATPSRLYRLIPY